MPPNDRLANGEANANRSILDAKSAFENMLHVAVGDAKAIVKNRKDDRPVFIEPSPDVDQVRWLSRLCDRLDAVDQQVDYHLLQLNPFACHAGNVAPYLSTQ